MKFRKLFADLITIGLVVLWGYAGITKLLAYSFFAQQLQSYPIIKYYSTPVSIAMSITMLIIAVLLTLQIRMIQTLSLSALFLAFIKAYLIYVVKLSGMAPCSCNGIWPSTSWDVQIGINILVLVLNLTAIYFRKSTSEKNYNACHINHAL